MYLKGVMSAMMLGVMTLNCVFRMLVTWLLLKLSIIVDVASSLLSVGSLEVMTAKGQWILRRLWPLNNFAAILTQVTSASIHLLNCVNYIKGILGTKMDTVAPISNVNWKIIMEMMSPLQCRWENPQSIASVTPNITHYVQNGKLIDRCRVITFQLWKWLLPLSAMI